MPFHISINIIYSMHIALFASELWQTRAECGKCIGIIFALQFNSTNYSAVFRNCLHRIDLILIKKNKWIRAMHCRRIVVTSFRSSDVQQWVSSLRPSNAECVIIQDEPASSANVELNLICVTTVLVHFIQFSSRRFASPRFSHLNAEFSELFSFRQQW